MGDSTVLFILKKWPVVLQKVLVSCHKHSLKKKKKNPIWNFPGKSWWLGSWYKGAHFILHFPYLVSCSTFFFFGLMNILYL